MQPYSRARRLHPAAHFVQVPAGLLASCDCCAVHFGHSIHFMTKGMTQQEVANMFSHGHVCFRAFDPLTGKQEPEPCAAVAGGLMLEHLFPESKV